MISITSVELTLTPHSPSHTSFDDLDPFSKSLESVKKIMKVVPSSFKIECESTEHLLFLFLHSDSQHKPFVIVSEHVQLALCVTVSCRGKKWFSCPWVLLNSIVLLQAFVVLRGDWAVKNNKIVF